jgi:transposase
MAKERLSMRQVREVLRLKSLGLSPRKIAQSIGAGRTTVQDYLRRAEAAGIFWPLPEDLDDQALEDRLFKVKERPLGRDLPDWNWVLAELRRKHVTLALIWEEYKAQHPNGYQYSQFCDLYRRWAGALSVSMRQEYRGGEKMFVDFSGDGIPWIQHGTGEILEAQLFVAALGASSSIYAEAFPSQELPHWIAGHVHAYEYFAGVTRLTIPDQPRTAVSKPCRYEPELNPAYQEMADHYGTCILPARPRKPRDKAKVEVSVLVAQRWIIAALRNRTFFSILAINQAIRELLEKINHRLMRKLNRSRWELYLELDKPNLQPLPERPYEFASWKVALRVNVDYHVEFEKCYYSVPYQLVHQEVDLRATAATVEIFHRHKRIASHLRSLSPHRHVTLTDHMPRSHRAHAEWTPSRIIQWAKQTGPSTAQLVENIMAERKHRASLGILRLAKRYSPERLDKACFRALATKSHSYRFVDSVLKNRLENQPLPQRTGAALPRHDNLRGASYYQ